PFPGLCPRRSSNRDGQCGARRPDLGLSLAVLALHHAVASQARQRIRCAALGVVGNVPLRRRYGRCAEAPNGTTLTAFFGLPAMTYTDKIIAGSPKNAVSVVPF